ncbi:glycylpeptide N-tetradecanoyltransferase 2-like [Xenia sp. Carnegie-2017]|uniref:glycylpeptide N-tetradecanoyltransferase 2-like n=1 Tax=Xenia sp. Carnegie-2017 TaxID=2897299 RepID=UPI001F03CEDC|nr:glycylpeptide N-tetradecanoyltransferase 2-like [Xenia sp. Carnegie-2017]
MADDEKTENCEESSEKDDTADSPLANGVSESSEFKNSAVITSNNKKKKKKGKKKDESTSLLPSPQALAQLQKAVGRLRFNEAINGGKGKGKNANVFEKKYEFWDTQPVPKLTEVCLENRAVEDDKKIEDIRQDEYSLPNGFEWATLDIDDEMQLKELYQLLNENYVEDDDNMFRFDYSSDFLKWALKPPEWKKQWHCGVRVSSNKKLVGFISAVPATINIYNTVKKCVEINFLCVHKKLREKRVAPVLIREITRRVNLQGIFQAVYTAGVVLPKPVSACRYWHRSLNPKKLVDCKFSNLSKNMTMSRLIKLYKLPEEITLPNLYPILPNDMEDAYLIVKEYLKKFSLSPVFSKEEFLHWFTPRDGVMTCYVVKNDEGKITDLISYYTLPSTIMKHPTHKSLNAAYSFYNVSTVTPLSDLMQNALIIAKQNGFDVFNALDLMDNKEILEKLKFGIGDGNLQYYLYNWKCPYMECEKVGLVLQ